MVPLNEYLGEFFVCYFYFIGPVYRMMMDNLYTRVLHFFTRCNCKQKSTKYPAMQEDKDVKNIQTFGII